MKGNLRTGIEKKNHQSQLVPPLLALFLLFYRHIEDRKRRSLRVIQWAKFGFLHLCTNVVSYSSHDHSKLICCCSCFLCLFVHNRCSWRSSTWMTTDHASLSACLTPACLRTSPAGRPLSQWGPLTWTRGKTERCSSACWVHMQVCADETLWRTVGFAPTCTRDKKAELTDTCVLF